MERILNYKLTLEVLGPLFIGSGNEVSKSEYIHDRKNNKIYVMNPLKMFKGLNEINLLNEYQKGIIKESRRFNLSAFVKNFDVSKNDYMKWADYSFDTPPNGDFSKAHISAFIKDAYNMPYIPGSSIKGAIKNAYLNALLIRSDKFSDLAKDVERAYFSDRDRTRYMAFEEKEINVRALHTLKRPDIEKEDILNDMFCGLRISDSQPLSLGNIILCEKQDILPTRKMNKPHVQRECLKPGTKVVFDVEIDTKIFKYSGEKLAKIVNLMYNNINEVFLSHFNCNVKKEKGNLLYVGGGAGFLSKTVIYSLFKEKQRAVRVASEILDNTDSKKKTGKHKSDPIEYGISPHTRKCTTYQGRLYDFGLCRIDFQPM